MTLRYGGPMGTIPYKRLIIVNKSPYKMEFDLLLLTDAE